MTSFSRRQMLALIGAGGLVVAGTCSGLTALTLLALRERNRQPKVLYVTETPAPTAISVIYPALIRREDWGALPPNHAALNEAGYFDAETNVEGWRIYAPPLSERYQTVVLHHSVVDTGDALTTLQAIQDLHRKDRGWADVAYHYFVSKEGRVYAGRDLDVRGTHVAGYNTGSVGVCLLGDFTVDSPTDLQINATLNLILWLAEALDLTHIAGHGDFNPGTVCPGDKLRAFIDSFAESAHLSVGTEGYIAPDETA